MIEGNYPNYKQVIPAETKERVTLERETFLNSLRRVSLLASDKSNSIKLNFSKNNIDITANTPEVGEAKESLAGDLQRPRFFDRVQSGISDGAAAQP